MDYSYSEVNPYSMLKITEYDVHLICLDYFGMHSALKC